MSLGPPEGAIIAQNDLKRSPGHRKENKSQQFSQFRPTKTPCEGTVGKTTSLLLLDTRTKGRDLFVSVKSLSALTCEIQCQVAVELRCLCVMVDRN